MQTSLAGLRRDMLIVTALGRILDDRVARVYLRSVALTLSCIFFGLTCPICLTCACPAVTLCCPCVHRLHLPALACPLASIFWPCLPRLFFVLTLFSIFLCLASTLALVRRPPSIHYDHIYRTCVPSTDACNMQASSMILPSEALPSVLRPPCSSRLSLTCLGRSLERSPRIIVHYQAYQVNQYPQGEDCTGYHKRGHGPLLGHRRTTGTRQQGLFLAISGSL